MAEITTLTSWHEGERDADGRESGGTMEWGSGGVLEWESRGAGGRGTGDRGSGWTRERES